MLFECMTRKPYTNYHMNQRDTYLGFHQSRCLSLNLQGTTIHIQNPATLYDDRTNKPYVLYEIYIEVC